jgi:serine/threonine-protein kinase
MTPLSQFEAHWPAISALLDEALNLSPAERAQWLESLVGEHAAHREALRTLLAHQAEVETGDFLSTLPRLDAKHAVAPPSGPTAGSSVGAYRLIAEIGQGGMGTVWLAERSDGLVNRRVALKLPRMVWGDSFAERLSREREILATLEHEHIARLYDAGVDAQGRPFLAMEHVDGEPIDAYCHKQDLLVRERIALLLQVMAAVGHAHARLVVHRDLKPSNILVTWDAKVKLLDFGIAQLLEGDSTRRSALTELTGRALTLDYASPEQIRGEPMGTGGDVYALGVVAFEVLAGTRPYRLKRGSPAEIEEAIASAEPRLASEAAISPALRKQLRGDLDAILNRALKKSVDDRYPSVEAFAQDLKRHLRGEPVLARPDSPRYRAGKFIRRNRLAVTMTAALAVSVVAGGTLSVWQAMAARRQEDLASAEAVRQRAVRDLYVEAMTRLSVMGAEEPEALARPHAVTTTLRQKLDDLTTRFKEHPGGREAQLEAVMLQLNYDNQFEDSLAVGREYLSDLKAQDAAPAQVIDAYAALGRTLFQLQRFDESESLRREGLAWAPDADDLRTRVARIVIASELGGSLTAVGKRAEAATMLARADKEASHEFPEHNLRNENLFRQSLYWLGFDDARALQLAQQGRAGQLVTGTADPNQLAHGLQYLGNALVANGRPAEAEATWREAMAETVQQYGRGSSHGVRALARVIDAVARQGDFVRADAMIADERAALAGLPAGLSPFATRQFQALQIENAWLVGDVAAAKSRLIANTSELLAPRAVRENEMPLLWHIRALSLAGQPREALLILRTMQLNWPEAGRPTLSWSRLLETQAGLELAANEPAQARTTARSLIEMLEQQRATTGRAYRSAVELEALAAARLGDKATAERALDRAPASQSVAYPSRVERAEALLRRAETLASIGRSAEAASTARTAMADLASQHPDSPRLAAARRLAATDTPH